MGYKDLSPEAQKRFRDAHKKDGSEFHGTGWGAKIQKVLLDRHNKGKNKGKVKRIPVIPYDPNTEANAKPEKRK
jgi:hypothetical protein